MNVKGTAIFVVGVVLVLALVGVAYDLILGWESQPSDTPGAAGAAGTGQVVKTTGVVEIRVGGGAEWKPITVGDQIAPGQDLRTKADSAASFQYGDDLSVDVLADSRVKFEEADDKVAKFVVGEGLTIIDVKPESNRLVRVAAEGSDAVAETRDGRIHVLSDGEGNVEAAVTRGSAKLTAQGETVDLQAGFGSKVSPGKAPGTPHAIPKSLLLKVKWPKSGATAKKRHLVTGTASPGARVKVGRKIVRANAEGTFEAVVDLPDGRNRIRVSAIDVVGNTAADSSDEIQVDTKAPGHAVETRPGMWKRKKSKKKK